MDSEESAFDLFQRGSHLLEERHPAAAAVVLERCLALEPGKASIQEGLARAYYDEGARSVARFAREGAFRAQPWPDRGARH